MAVQLVAAVRRGATTVIINDCTFELPPPGPAWIPRPPPAQLAQVAKFIEHARMPTPDEPWANVELAEWW